MCSTPMYKVNDLYFYIEVHMKIIFTFSILAIIGILLIVPMDQKKAAEIFDEHALRPIMVNASY